ncbi:hypothetical protein CRENBAI_003638 [Crenichthys baileyi]|uniref:Uncharacterized protein n=1 Tax=Crenichthys baileyi TaxID=28760 RepID=A0AAV9RGK4_9TELE
MRGTRHRYPATLSHPPVQVKLATQQLMGGNSAIPTDRKASGMSKELDPNRAQPSPCSPQLAQNILLNYRPPALQSKKEGNEEEVQLGRHIPHVHSKTIHILDTDKAE